MVCLSLLIVRRTRNCARAAGTCPRHGRRTEACGRGARVATVVLVHTLTSNLACGVLSALCFVCDELSCQSAARGVGAGGGGAQTVAQADAQGGAETAAEAAS